MNLAVLAYNVEFQGRRRRPEYMDPPKKEVEPQKYEDLGIEISNKSKKLFSALNNQIDNDWGSIKKGELVASSPMYSLYNKADGLVTIKPLYGGIEPKILMEFENDKHIERLIFSRSNPQNFRYEKSVTTDFGSATLNSFDSTVQKNSKMIMFANEKIAKYIPKILKNRIKIDYFGVRSGVKKAIIKVVM